MAVYCSFWIKTVAMTSTATQIIEDNRSFKPMDIQFIQRCINDFKDRKYHDGTTFHMNSGARIERCLKCGSVHFVKNVMRLDSISVSPIRLLHYFTSIAFTTSNICLSPKKLLCLLSYNQIF